MKLLTEEDLEDIRKIVSHECREAIADLLRGFVDIAHKAKEEQQKHTHT